MWAVPKGAAIFNQPGLFGEGPFSGGVVVVVGLQGSLHGNTGGLALQGKLGTRDTFPTQEEERETGKEACEE